jgi:hypothetical protein
MNNPRKVDLTSASAVYAVSNSPLFLLRKLRADAAPRAIASSASKEEILTKLEASLSIKPKSLEEAVLPYVLLVALSQMNDVSSLEKASGFRALYHDWFTYVAVALVQLFRPTIISQISSPAKLLGPLPSSTSSAPNNPIIIRP